MIIRMIVDNYMSFGKEQEFNMLANAKNSRMNHHCLKSGGLKILKMAAMYGGNASGKTNFVTCLNMIHLVVTREEIPNTFQKFRSKTSVPPDAPDREQSFLIEVLIEGAVYIYEFGIVANRFSREALSISGKGAKPDVNVFTRRVNQAGETELEFSREIGLSEEELQIVKLVEKNFLKPNVSVMKVISGLNTQTTFVCVRSVYSWFASDLQFVYPPSRANGITELLQINSDFRDFALDLFRRLGLGVSRFELVEQSLEEFQRAGFRLPPGFLDDLEEGKMKVLRDQGGDRGTEILVRKAGNTAVIKKTQFFHQNREGEVLVPFELSEESDGTIRLFELLPAFYFVMHRGGTIVVDEIERSVHPLLIKKLFKWMSEYQDLKGQLIFTTHESSLLDNRLFRQDEIWFAEKNGNGNTELHSLSDFKEHHTMDLRKGYLSGRYGGIPMLDDFPVEALHV